jgi:GNAT superfamily N-acetyltransferase
MAWRGVNQGYQGQKLGDLLLAQALRDCHEAGQTFAFVAVILDCVDDRAKAFYQHLDFAEIPRGPFRLFLCSQTLSAMMTPR